MDGRRPIGDGVCHVDGRRPIGDVGMSLPPEADSTEQIDPDEINDEIVGDLGDLNLSCDHGMGGPTASFSLGHASEGAGSEPAEILDRVFSRCVAHLLADATRTNTALRRSILETVTLSSSSA